MRDSVYLLLYWCVVFTSIKLQLCQCHIRWSSELWTSLPCTWLMQVNCSWNQKDDFYLQQKRQPRTQVSQTCIRIQEVRVMRNRCLRTNSRRPLTFTAWGLPDSLRSRLCFNVIFLPFITLARAHGSILCILKMNSATGPDANLHVDSPSLPLIFFQGQMNVPFQLWSWKRQLISVHCQISFLE